MFLLLILVWAQEALLMSAEQGILEALMTRAALGPEAELLEGVVMVEGEQGMEDTADRSMTRRALAVFFTEALWFLLHWEAEAREGI
jgi:hypothetical protein